jgi:hypothetical protein
LSSYFPFMRQRTTTRRVMIGWLFSVSR